MTLLPSTFVGRLRLAASLVVAGLTICLLTLLWTHPLSFVVYMSVAGLLVFLGVVLYLLSLLKFLGNQSGDATADESNG